MQLKQSINISATVAALLTTGWVVLAALSMASVEPGWTDQEYLQWASYPDAVYIANYANMLLVTTSVVILFGLLALYFRERFPVAVAAGLLFVPVYAALQYISYGLQISVVPSLARKALEQPELTAMTVQLMQVKTDTFVGFLNGLGYAVLAIPSILYGRLLDLDRKRLAGMLLFANGVLCLVALVGYLLQNPLLMGAVVAGGVLFLLSLFAIGWAFRR